jgi:hypothetical protein
MRYCATWTLNGLGPVSARPVVNGTPFLSTTQLGQIVGCGEQLARIVGERAEHLVLLGGVTALRCNPRASRASRSTWRARM